MSTATKDRRYGLRRWRRLRTQALHRDGYRCTWPDCNADLRGHRRAFVDHIHEVRDGGPFWNLANLQSLCWNHHQAKTHGSAADRDDDGPQSPNA